MDELIAPERPRRIARAEYDQMVEMGIDKLLGSMDTGELRKYVDVARQAPASSLFLVDADGEREIDCLGATGFPFFGQLIRDCIERTEYAMSQEHAFKAAQVSMQAQQWADEHRAPQACSASHRAGEHG